MDKFNGIKRATITKCKYDYEGEEPAADIKLSKSANKNKSKKGVFTLIRYGVCAAAILVCFLSNALNFTALTKAAGFIKDELKRDYISEIMGRND